MTALQYTSANIMTGHKAQKRNVFSML